jgi:hypothetical protein
MDDSNKNDLFAELIPDMRLWNNGAGIDVDGWLAGSGNYELAIAFGELFWPRFVLVDVCVFWADEDGGLRESFETWMVQLKGDKRAVEAMLNHRHIIDLFPSAAPKATQPQLVYLGRLLREIWSCKLAHDFPNRLFEVVFSEGNAGDLIGYEVTFCQKRLDSQAG